MRKKNNTRKKRLIAKIEKLERRNKWLFDSRKIYALAIRRMERQLLKTKAS